MNAIYALCPHCGFPAVIMGLDRHLSRHCRQCREKFVPALAVADRKPARVILDEHAQRHRQRLFDRVRRTRRKTVT